MWLFRHLEMDFKLCKGNWKKSRQAGTLQTWKLLDMCAHILQNFLPWLDHCVAQWAGGARALRAEKSRPIFPQPVSTPRQGCRSLYCSRPSMIHDLRYEAKFLLFIVARTALLFRPLMGKFTESPDFAISPGFFYVLPTRFSVIEISAKCGPA